jgi:hypothetical protein
MAVANHGRQADDPGAHLSLIHVTRPDKHLPRLAPPVTVAPRSFRHGQLPSAKTLHSPTHSPTYKENKNAKEHDLPVGWVSGGGAFDLSLSHLFWHPV